MLRGDIIFKMDMFLWRVFVNPIIDSRLHHDMSILPLNLQILLIHEESVESCWLMIDPHESVFSELRQVRT